MPGTLRVAHLLSKLGPRVSYFAPSYCTYARSELATQILRDVRPTSRPSTVTVALQQLDFVVLELTLMAEKHAVIDFLTPAAGKRPNRFNVLCQLISGHVPIDRWCKPIVSLAFNPTRNASAPQE
jgi:hypothetical protein